MTETTLILAGTAAFVGFLHTLVGPDHYLPFIVLSKARKWSLSKTMSITFLCGMGHVLSSVILGLLGAAGVLALEKVKIIESFRGTLAAQALVVFGVSYCIWGLIHAYKNKHHHHTHLSDKKVLTTWILFTVFVLGPCEPLIPLIMYPAMESTPLSVGIVAAVFSLATVGTMMCVVLISSYGIRLINLHILERFSHALAGAAIALSGLAILFLGL